MDRGFAIAREWAARSIFGFKRRGLGRNFDISVHNCLDGLLQGWQLIVLLVRCFWKLRFPMEKTRGNNSDIVLQSHPLDCLSGAGFRPRVLGTVGCKLGENESLE